MKKGRILVRILALAIIVGIAAWMFVIGRGHTIYFDNKELEFDGKTYKSFYTVEVFVDGQSVAKLRDGDRGMVTTTGQNFSMEVHITPKKGGKKTGGKVTLPIPYDLDGIVLNIPAMFQQAPEEAYMTEFIPLATTEDETEDIQIGEGFDMNAEG